MHILQKNRDKVQNTTAAPEKKENNRVQQFSSMCTFWTPEDGRLWPKHVAWKHFHGYFILILFNSDELCCTRDCVLKETIYIVFLSSVLPLLVTVYVVPTSSILVTLMLEAIRSSKTSVRTRSTCLAFFLFIRVDSTHQNKALNLFSCFPMKLHIYLLNGRSLLQSVSLYMFSSSNTC
jgi:hypothetical protein